MASDFTICIGTVGGGLNVSPDGGESWNRIRQPIPSEGTVRTLAVYPNDPHYLLAGSDTGLFRSDNNGGDWEQVDTPTEGLQIWSVAIDPVDPDILFLGTRPGVFRSRDAGKTWDQLRVDVADPCPIGVSRTTNIIVDPRDHRTIWAGIEVDGVFKSLDGGDTWVHLPDLGPDPFHGDIHGMALRTDSQNAVFCGTPFGLSTSTDEGESWELHEFPKHHEGDRWSYCRDVAIKHDDANIMFVGNGDTIPGVTGAIQITRDGGTTWQQADLPVTPNSVVYWFGLSPERPDVVAACSLYGYVYLSEDGGSSWRKLKKEFGEIRAVTVTPN